LTFVVNIKENSSDPLPLHQGVPQGSVLGLLFFILFTTPLSSLSSKTKEIVYCHPNLRKSVDLPAIQAIEQIKETKILGVIDLLCLTVQLIYTKPRLSIDVYLTIYNCR